MLPARLESFAPLMLTSWPMSTSMSLLGVVARRAGERLEPVHVAVVVGAEQVDLVAEAAVALVEVVRGVGREVRVGAVAAADDPVLVVAEVGRAHPHGVVLVEDVALRAQALDGGVDVGQAVVALRLQAALARPDVEVHVEAVERRADLGELQLVGDLGRGVQRDGLVELEQVRLALEHPRREVGDVAARDSRPRGRLALGRRQHRQRRSCPSGCRRR